MGRENLLQAPEPEKKGKKEKKKTLEECVLHIYRKFLFISGNQGRVKICSREGGDLFLRSVTIIKMITM